MKYWMILTAAVILQIVSVLSFREWYNWPYPQVQRVSGYPPQQIEHYRGRNFQHTNVNGGPKGNIQMTQVRTDPVGQGGYYNRDNSIRTNPSAPSWRQQPNPWTMRFPYQTPSGQNFQFQNGEDSKSRKPQGRYNPQIQGGIRVNGGSFSMADLPNIQYQSSGPDNRMEMFQSGSSRHGPGIQIQLADNRRGGATRMYQSGDGVQIQGVGNVNPRGGVYF